MHLVSCTEVRSNRKLLLSLRRFSRNSKLNRFCKILQCRLWWQSINSLVSCTTSQTDGRTSERLHVLFCLLHKERLVTDRLYINYNSQAQNTVPVILHMFGPNDASLVWSQRHMFGPSDASNVRPNDTSHVMFLRRRLKGQMLPCTWTNRLLFQTILM